MKNRRHFLSLLTAVSGAALGVSTVGADRQSSSLRATPAARNTPSSTSEPAGVPPSAVPHSAASAAALALASEFRAFDPHLSEAEVETIAHSIDANRAAGAVLNPKRKPLRNSDEMVARFAVEPASHA